MSRSEALSATHRSSLPCGDKVIDYQGGYVNAGGRDSVLELCRVVHLMDDETIRALHQVDTQDLPTDHLRGTDGEFGKFVCYLAVRRLPPSRRVGPPIAALRSPVYRRDCLASDDERADIPRGPLDEFLQVVNPVEGAHLLPVLEDGARHIPVPDQRRAPPPPTYDRLA